MKIVFLETGTLGTDIDFTKFNELGEVVLYNYSEPSKNTLRIADADIVVVNKIPVDEALLSNAKNVKLIALSATGTNNVDFSYTNSRGIKVCNASGYSTSSVVQHTFAMLFYLYEKLPIYDEFVKNGKYSSYPMFSCFEPYFNELSGKTWGIIGLGAIGKGVARIAESFGCNVIYYSTSGRNSSSEYEKVSLECLLSKSDIISIHCPLTQKTKNLINTKTLSAMKHDAILLNLARGPIVDEEALAIALNNNVITAAGLDVLCTEPVPADNPLMSIKDSSRLLITPHMAWGTKEARVRCVNEVYENILSFQKQIDRNIVRC